jgi:hypothetical protein
MLSLARQRRAAAAGVVATAATLVLAAAGAALPPGGTDDQPGTPAGSLAVTTPDVAQKGAVGFCVENIRVDSSSGHVAQPFVLKFDDHGSSGIGPFTPDADGHLCASASTDPAAYATAKGGSADKIPPDLCDPTKEHWLRLLSGGWAAENASQRSLAATFRVTGACGDGAGGGGTTTTPTTTATTPAPGPGDTTTTPTTTTKPSVDVRLRSVKLAVSGRSLVVKLRGGRAFTRGTLLVTSRSRLRVGRSGATRRALAKGSFQLAAGDTVALRLPLTADGRSLLKNRRTLAASLAVAAGGATTTTTNVTVTTPRTQG